jgi:hypothetical protein
MCFSAKASFLASGLLLSVGVATVAIAQGKADRSILPLAMAPLFFGFQQATEGFVWLGIQAQPLASGDESTPTTLLGAALTYLFFAYAFWPVWIPWSAIRLLPHPEGSGSLLQWLPALGLVPGVVLWLPLVSHPRMALPVGIGHSLVYRLHPWSEHLLPALVGPMLYAAWMVLPMLLVRSVRVRTFALSLLLAFCLTKWAINLALTSVWCFASALLAVQILWILQETPLGQHQPPLKEHTQSQT